MLKFCKKSRRPARKLVEIKENYPKNRLIDYTKVVVC